MTVTIVYCPNYSRYSFWKHFSGHRSRAVIIISHCSTRTVVCKRSIKLGTYNGVVTYSRVGISCGIWNASDNRRFVVFYRNYRSTSSGLTVAVVYCPNYSRYSFWKHFSGHCSRSVIIVGNASVCTVIGKGGIKFGTYYCITTYSRIGVPCGIWHTGNYWRFVVFNGDYRSTSSGLTVAIVYCPNYSRYSFWKHCSSHSCCTVIIISHCSTRTVVCKRGIKLSSYYCITTYSRVGVSCGVWHASDNWVFVVFNGDYRSTSIRLTVAIIHCPNHSRYSFWKHFSGHSSRSVIIVGKCATRTVIGKGSIKFSTYYCITTHSRIGVSCGIWHTGNYWCFIIFNSDNSLAENNRICTIKHCPNNCCASYRENSSCQ